MKAFTHSKRVYVPMKTIDDLLNKCEDDADVWTVLFASGMTVMVKPTTQAERDFYREEMMIRAEIEKLGVNNAALWKDRWSV